MKQEINQTTEVNGSDRDIHQQETDSDQVPAPPEEIGGPKGPEPTRYGDWERKGRCIDF